MFQNDNCVTAFQIFFIEFQDLKIEKLLNHLFYRYFCYNFFFFFNLINSSIFQGEVKGSVGLSLEIAGILTYILWRRHGDKYHEYSNVQLFFFSSNFQCVWPQPILRLPGCRASVVFLMPPTPQWSRQREQAAWGTL